MKRIALMLLVILATSSSFSQPAILIDPNGDGGFESGPTFNGNGWIVANDGTNKWYVGTPAKRDGLRGAYISSNGGTFDVYDNSVAQVSHFYRDVQFPAGKTLILLRFTHRSNWDSYNEMRVFLVSTETTPVAGEVLTTGLLGIFKGESFAVFREYCVVIPISAAGTTKRLVFSWQNDDQFGYQPPATVDNISLVAEGSIPSNGTGGGVWSSGATWTGGIPPGPSDNVSIRDGDVVEVDTDVEVKQICVGEGNSGKLKIKSQSSRRCTAGRVVFVQLSEVTSDVGVTANHELIISDDFFNNGTFDGSTNNGQAGIAVEFNGSADQIFSGTGPVTNITSITVNVATSTATVLIEPDNLTVQGLSANAPGFLNLLKGTAKISGDFPLETVLFPTTSPIIATGTAFVLDNPNFIVKPQNGTVTLQGTLRVSNGTFNVGIDEDDCLILVPGSWFISEGGSVTAASAIGVTSPSNIVNFTQTGGTILVQKVGNSSTSFAGFDLGFSSSTNATSTAGTLVIQNANSAVSGPGDVRTPLTFTINTLQLGNATTSAQSVFRIRGGVSNLVFDQTFNHTVQLAGPVTLASSTTIPSGWTLSPNGNTLSVRRDLDIAAGAIFNATTTASTLSFSGTVQQTFSNSGTIVDGYIRSLVINNSSGATPAVAINDNFAISNSLFLTFGSLGGSGTPTFGNPSASSSMMMTRVNGSLLSQPVFDPGAIFNANYNISVTQTVTGPELPSIVTGTLTINDPSGVLLIATTTAQKLTLTNGILTTATSSPLIIAGTNPTDVTGGSSTSFLKGPLIRTFPATLAAGTEYIFPVGKETYNPVNLVDAVRNATTTATVLAEVVQENFTGTAGTGIGEIEFSSLWNVGPTDPLDILFEQLRLRFPNRSSLGSGSRIGKADAADGTFNSIGGSVSGNSITSDIINSFSYFAIGVTNYIFSGTYTVGASGADYPTITAAVADIDSGGFAGPVVLSLIDASYPSETFPIVINQIAGADATKTLTIKPASGIAPTITGAPFNTAIIKLEGADYVTIDGSNNGTNSRDMTISNTYGGGGHAIWLSSQGAGLGARNNVLKNLNISAGSDQTQSNTITAGILSSGTTISVLNDGADNDNNLIQNNYIKKARYGIFLRGAASNPNDGNSILSNLVGPAAFGSDQIGKGGIVVQSQSGVTISNNEIRFVGALASQSIPEAASEDRVGIGLGAEFWTPGFFDGSTITNALVTNNLVHDVIEEKTKSAAGILSAAGGSPTNNLVANNLVYNVHANGTSGEQGVGIGIHAGSGDKIVFNSIRLEGDIDPPSSTTATGNGIGIRVTGGSNLIVKNNIISVDLTSNVDTVKHYAIVAPSFYNWGTGGLDYNDYYVNASNVQMRVGGIGSAGIALTPSADLPAWRGNFSGTQDVHSHSFAPDFTSATDLHLNVGAVNTNYIGTPIAGVTVDVDGETRGSSSPYIGADEVVGYPLPILPPGTPLLVAPLNNATDQSLSPILLWKSSPTATSYHVQAGTDSSYASPLVNDSTLADTTNQIGPLADTTNYYWRVRAANAGGQSAWSYSWNFRTTVSPPAVPTLLVPSTGAAFQQTTLTLKWNTVVGATGYQSQLSVDSLFSSFVFSDSTLTDTTKQAGPLANNTKYFWRVRAYNAGGASEFSTVFSFTTIPGAPAAPVNLSATPGNAQVALKWRKNNEPNILRYRIFHGTSPNPSVPTDSTIGGISDTTKTVTGLTNGTTYYFRVTALDSSFLESPYSNEVSATPADVNAPSPPAGLVVKDSSSRTLIVAWQKNVETDFLRYRIYRGTVPNPTTTVDSTGGGIGDTSKVMIGLTNKTRYYVRVTAVDSAGNESGYSNEVNAAPADRIPPAAPQSLVAVDSSSTQVGIKWRRNAEADFLKYMIYRGTAPNPTTRIDSTSAGPADTAKTLAGLINGTRYFFRVTAVDSAGNESAYSNEVNAAPNAPTGIEDILSQIPKEFTLSQNYPNPFNPSTVIRYGLPERSNVRLEIYDMLGRSVAVLVDQQEDARYYEVSWDAGVPSGIYFCRISAVAVANPDRTFVQVRKMILLK